MCVHTAVIQAPTLKQQTIHMLTRLAKLNQPLKKSLVLNGPTLNCIDNKIHELHYKNYQCLNLYLLAFQLQVLLF